MFKVGDKVKCVTKETGKIYNEIFTVKSITDSMIFLEETSGGWLKSRFIKVCLNSLEQEIHDLETMGINS